MPERYLGRTLGKYRVESLLGSGGFAWVFKGYDPELDIPVAIKVLKPQFAGDTTLVERFRREASTAAKLRHPNIIKIYAVGREGDAVYFVMDYLPSGLADKLEATASLPEDYVVRIGIDVARALGFAHREGVIHRDIKVDNILFDTHGNAVVADFGIARAVSGYVNQTGTNMVVGTPQYFAPEQARAKPLDGRADIYSLGVTLFRASTGRLPFEGEDWYEIARQHVEEPPPAPRSINPSLTSEFDGVLLRCLSKPVEERPETGEQLAEELEQILAVKKDPTLSRTMAVPATGGPTVRVPSARITKNAPSWRSPGRLAVMGSIVAVALVTLAVSQLAGRFETMPGNLTLDTVTVGAPTLIIPESLAADSSRRASRDTGASTTPASATPLSITAPAGAIVTVNNVQVGTGPVRVDTLQPGEYAVTASVQTLPGCPESVDRATVRVRAGRGGESVTLNPRACGTLSFSAQGYSARDNQPKPGRMVYELVAAGAVVRAGELPLSAPLTVPAGPYRLTITQPLCSPHDQDVVVRPEVPNTLERLRLICF